MTGPAENRPARVGPVAARVEIETRGEDGLPVAARVTIAADEPVFAGHYPHFPIFPGVCVLECVQRAATDGPDAPDPRDLAAVESARFAGAAYPGDVLTLALKWRRTDAGLRCDATAATERGKAASVRLRFEPSGGTR
ncbi:3-hydroxyacyl-ACP dehydratase FabZ family protein [Streptomyces sp. CB03234]|uniref:3-hydroxyacyl-ACP dehydratase FabZ family protein n=1 Tax=Streptomyces sp. (strain CB03234) TaxID=1703937 RepID=UPI00093DFCEC|nr:hypothetical protein [Streptomyces sp. CB03234]